MNKRIFVTLLSGIMAFGGAWFTGCNVKESETHTHSYSATAVAPTCTENGYTLHECSCGDSYTDNEVPATGHTEVTVEGKAATCTEDGLTDGKRCIVCNTVTLEQEVIKATGHNFENGKCTVCGERDPDITETESLTYEAITGNGATVAYAVTGISDDNEAYVIIPNEHDGLPVTKISAKAFYDCQNIIGVTVPDSVEEIETMAFYWCENLKDITFGKSLKTVGAYALGGCFGLESIEISEENPTLKSQGNCIIDKDNMTVIAGCSASVIPDGVKSIASYSFAYCAAPEELNFPSSVETIEQKAFYHSYNLKKVTIPSTVKSVGGYAFAYCQDLEYVDVNCAEFSGMYVFDYNYKLFSMTIGENVASFKGSLIVGCGRLIDIYNKSSVTLANNPATDIYVRNIYSDQSKRGEFTDVNGYKFYTCKNEDGEDEFYLMGYYGEDTELTLPSPSEIKFEGKNAATYKINRYALYGMTEITSVKIPEGVTEIGVSSFRADTALESVEIGSSVTNIMCYAFWGATNLTSLTIPENVEYVELNAFKGLTALTDVYWNAVECTTNIDSSLGTMNGTVNNRIFYGCTNLSNVVFGDRVKVIPEALFRGCEAITEITIPSSVTSIGYAAFYTCTNLASVTFEDTSSDWVRAYNASGTGSASNPPETVTAAQLADKSEAAQRLAYTGDYKYKYGYYIKQT